MQLTKHFSMYELTRSSYAMRHGLDNTPHDDLYSNAVLLADGLERVRRVLGVPMRITSGYRSQKVNAGVGGSKTSAHTKFLAADFIPDMDLLDACDMIIEAEDEIGFDQLIYEGDWIHISFADEPRGEVWTAHFNRGKVTYTAGIE